MYFKSTKFKRNNLLLALLFAIITLSGNMMAQVNVTATAGSIGPTSYTSIGSAFAAINAGTHQGVISIAITANITESATPTPLLASAGTSSYTSVSIMPSGGSFTISSAAAPVTNRGIIELAGADNVTIDGDDPGTPGLQNLSIVSNAVSTSGVACIRLSSNSTTGTDGANNVTVKNCIIVGSRNSATSTVTNYGIQFSNGVGTSSSTTGAYSSLNTLIQNNTITRCYYGIHAIGNSATYVNTGLQIIGNTVGSATPSEYVGFTALDLSYTSSTVGATSALVSGNDFRSGHTSGNASMGALVLATTNAGAIITRNNIHDCINTTSSVWGMYGIWISSATNNIGINISNNMIRDITGAAVSSLGNQFGGSCIYISSAATNIIFNHNTIAQLNSAAIGSCILMGSSTATFAQFQNNILVNNVASPYSCLFYTGGTANISGGIVNYNNYYSNATGVFAYYNSSNVTNFASWKSATTKDASSKNVLPSFVSSTDLHITPAQLSFLESTGAPTASTGIVIDFDNDNRPGPTGSVNGGGTAPDIGADEFDGMPIPMCSGSPIAGTVTATSLGATCAGSTTLTINGQPTVLGITTQWQSSPDNITFTSIPTATNASYSTPTLSTTTYYQALVTCTASVLTATTNVITFSISPVTGGTAVVSSATVCPSANFNLSLTGNSTNGVTYQWQSSPNNSTWTSISSATLATATQSLLSNTYYQNVLTCGSSTVASSSVLVSAALTTTNTIPYFEGFEGITSNNQLPNCSWVASNLPIICKTYTAATGSNNQLPKTGAKFASFRFGTATAGDYFYTNGFQLTAGTTYSASAAYITDGATGWSNFSLLIGSSQSTVGLTAIASATGTLTNTTYSTLSNTFTVGSTGIYYAAVKAIGTSNPNYLSFDDLSIVAIPQAPPTPTQSAVVPTCLNGTELTVSGTPAAGDAWYWQSTAVGTSTNTPAIGNYTVYLNGTYYVRTYNASNNSWSVSSSSVVVSNMPVAPLPPTPTGITPACLSTNLTVPASGNPNISYYWQGTNSTGTSTLTNASSAYTVTTSGTYYVAAYDISTGCWSATNSTSVTIQTGVPVAPTTAISSVSVCQGASSATITANTLSSSTQTVLLGSPGSIPGGTSSVFTKTISVPAGATITSSSLLFAGVTTIGLTYPSDVKATLSGAVTMASVSISSVGSAVSNATYTLTTPLLSSLGGVLTLTLTDAYSSGNATITAVSLVYSYTVAPSTLTWWDAPSAGVQQGTTNPLETVGTALLPNTSTIGTYTFYAGASQGVCPSTTRLPITVSVIAPPTAPLTSNSSQCGFGIPTASVSGSTSYRWYNATSGGTLLQSGSSSTYTSSISNTTTFYVASFNGICDGPRAAITASVTNPDPVTASISTTTLCSTGSATLTAVQTGSNNMYAFSWSASPSAGSGLASGVTALTTTVTPTLPGLYAYSITATDGVCTTVSTATLQFGTNPTVSVSVTPTVVCSGQNATLNAQAFAPLASTVTVGTGATTGTSYDAVFYHLYGGNKAQYIIRASELTAAGLVAGNITGLKLDIPTSGGTYAGFAISTGTTTNVDMSAGINTAALLTTVYSNANYTTLSGINAFTFSTPLVWDGTSNIIVQFCWSNNNGGGTSNFTKVVSTSYVSTAYYRDDNLTPSSICGGTTATGTVSSRPLFIFNGQKSSSVNSSMNFSWNPGAINTNTAVVNPVNGGSTPATSVYTVNVTNSFSGCSTTATVGVLVNPLPASPVTFNSIQCGLAVPTASVSGGTIYDWYATATSTPVLQSGASATYTSAINATTNFYVSTFNGTCESLRAMVTASVTSPDAVTASLTSTVICPGQSYTLTATKAAGSNNYAYTWTAVPASGSGIPTPVSGASVNVTPTSAGSYAYIVTAIDGACTTTTSVNGLVNPAPVVTAVASPTMVCSGSTVNLVGSSVSAGITSVGTGTTTTSTQGITPYGSNYEGSREQYLITAAELQAANLYAGNLTSLSFSVTAQGAGTYAQSNFSIKLAHTANTSLSSAYGTPTGAFTTVYGPASQALPALGANVYTFATPFNWDGVSNILVDICHDNDPTATCSLCYSSNSTVAYSTTSYNSVWGSYADNAQSCGVQAASTVSTYNNRPNMMFGGQVLNSTAGSLSWQWNPGAINTNTAIVAPVNTGATATTQVYTLTAINPSTGCSNTATTSVVVNPIPVAPTAFNSTQCGLAIPTASVSGGTSYNWYALPTSTTVLQAGSSATYTNAIIASTSWYVLSFSGTCESLRTLLTASVTAPDAVTAVSSSTAICPGQTFSLTATKVGTTNTYTYTWTGSPVAGSGISTPLSGTNVAVAGTIAGTYNYMVTAMDAACTTTAAVNVTIIAPPVISVSSSPTLACSGSSITLMAANGTSIPTGYCTPVSGASSCFTQVSINTLNRTSVCETGAYIDVPVSNASTNLTPGQSYVLNVTTNAAAITAVWFDWNKNGTFDASEWTQIYTSATTGTVAITVPLNAAQGATKMRLRSRGTGSANGSGDACTTFFSGEAEDYTVNILNSTGSSYTWQWNPGAVNSNTTIVAPTTGSTPSLYSYTVSAIDPVTTCSNTAVLTLTVNPSVTVTAVSSSSAICSGNLVSLTATGATTYTWMPAGGSASTATVTPGATTIYTVTGTSLGCSNTKTVSINVTATPTVIASASPTVICAGATVSLTATGAANYTWTPGSILTGTTTVTPTATTVYSVTGANGSCVNTKTVNVIVNTIPVINLNPSTTICTIAGSATLIATGTSTAYVWSNGPTTATNVVTPINPTSYTVTGTNICGTNTATTTVLLGSAPTVSASTSAPTICNNNSAVLTASGTATSYTWNTGATSLSITVTPTITTLYIVTGSNACGTASATVVQNVDPCTGLEETFNSDAVSIYPNPAHEFITIAIPASLASNTTLVEVTDAIGKLVMKESLNTDVTTINLNKLEDGVYFFKVISNNQTVKVGKVVKH